MILQFCGLSGAGKSTLARAVEIELQQQHVEVEILDGDEYRSTLCKDLGFTKEARHENIRRMTFVAHQLAKHGVVSVICAINPYEAVRREIAAAYPNVKTVFIDCAVETLAIRDTKGLYRRAMLPDDDPEKVKNLTGVNDPFERPSQPDLYINTGNETVESAAKKITAFIVNGIRKQPYYIHPAVFPQYTALRS
ncbi:MAG: adenylyl-sulfate kinase [Ferruginibacter sp.]